MTDSELQMKVLRFFYDNRSKHYVSPRPSDFDPQISMTDLQRICRQLTETDRVNATSGNWGYNPVANQFVNGGTISAVGVSIIEDDSLTNGRTQPKVKIEFSGPVQIGDHNIQTITNVLGDLLVQINKSSANDAEKKEASSKLKGFLYNPLVSSILGSGAVSAVFDLAKKLS